MSLSFDYLKTADDIYQSSFSIIRHEANLSSFPADIESVVVRLIHSCGMIDLAQDIKFSKNCVESGKQSLSSGNSIFCDVEMVKSGIIQSFLPHDNEVICTLNDDRVIPHSQHLGTTRSAAATDFWQDDQLKDSIVLIGNAPTALFHLLERLQTSDVSPSLIIAMPVGFVGAAESKQAIIDLHSQGNLPSDYITITGRRGGSALACATLNGLSK